MVQPFFKSHYSIGRSILTLDSDPVEDGPDSIIDIAKDNSFSEIVLIEDNMGGFLQAFQNLKEINVKLIYGLRLTICPNMETKDDESRLNSSKIIVLANNYNGYKSLIKIYTKAAKDGFYYEPRIDCENLKSLWNNKELTLVIPFYDSFIFKNLMTYASCTPDLSFTSPIFALEDNNIPFDDLVRAQVKDYVKDKHELMEVKSIFYKNREDFKAYLTFRCINNRSSLDKPNLEHMTSREFSLESWKEKNGTV
jgi:DNA polymerase-3 subunit alpha